MNLILIALITLGVIGAIGAVILYFVAQKFYVYEDPRIEQVEQVLPQANCGGCGYPGCKGFADACVKADSLEGLFCPVGGAVVMGKVASILGKEVVESEPKVAVVRCNGTCAARPKTSSYDGAKSCAIASNTFAGETGCSFGCLGFGDCEVSCSFDAIHINEETGLPVVDEEKCTACGSCVKACPKFIIELRAKGKNNRRVFVSCVNKDKGAAAKKACSNACIGCGKCAKECPFDAITIENNLAYIDYNKCKLCRKCVDVCPTGAIHAINFPPRKPKPAETPSENTVVAGSEKKVSNESTAIKDAQSKVSSEQSAENSSN
ncbi:MAG: Fe-S cluster domain-containing protein [Bacteroidales bacterium]|nr:Fe-S cluster domain-containing protein [Bacteroidales bacterium]